MLNQESDLVSPQQQEGFYTEEFEALMSQMEGRWVDYFKEIQN